MRSIDRSGRREWRRLALAALAPVLALTVTATVTVTAATAQDAWFAVPSVPVARSALAAATAPCPDARGDLRGRTNGKKKEPCVYAFGGGAFSADGGRIVYDTAEAYDPAANAWTALPPLPTLRDRLAGAAAPCPKDAEGPKNGGGTSEKNACVYAIGGSNLASPFLDTVEVYDPAANAWEALPPLPTPRRSLTAATAPCPEDVEGLKGTCVYAIGGLGSTGNQDAVEAYSPATGRWVSLPALPTARGVLAGAAAPCPRQAGGPKGTCVYTAGGFDGTEVLDTVEVYSPAADRWYALPPLPTARGFLAGASAPCVEDAKQTCVYAMGGITLETGILGTVEAYSPGDDRWASLPPLPTARGFLAGAAASCPEAVHDRGRAKSTCVYAIAGESDTGVLATVEALEVGSGR